MTSVHLHQNVDNYMQVPTLYCTGLYRACTGWFVLLSLPW